MRSIIGPYSGRRVALYCALGVAVGLTSLLTVSTSSLFLVTPLLLCLLYAGGGLIPMAVGLTVCAILFSTLLGPEAALLAALVLLLPAVVTVAGMQARLEYASFVKLCVAGYLGGVFVMLSAAGYMTGGQLVDRLVDIVRDTLEQMPSRLQDALLAAQYPNLPLTGTSFTSVVRERYLHDFINQMRSQLSNQVLPMLVESALFTAFLSCYLPLRAMFARGMVTEREFVPLSRWFMPHQMTVSLLLTTLVSYFLALSDIVGGEEVFSTMFVIMTTAFAVQGVAAMDRMLCRSNTGVWRKLFLIGAVYVFASTIVTAAGLTSALFGRKGVLRRFMPKDDQ